jgi:16S rRNA processing protein RimM
MNRDDQILLGTLAKTHGVGGELILRTVEAAAEPDEEWELVFLRIDGIPVPFFIESLREFREREWLLKLKWYDTRDRAEKLVGATVWIPAGWMGRVQNDLSPGELKGFVFKDKNTGMTGTVTAFLDIPGNPVFELKTGGKKILVPAREEFIREVDPAGRRIIFDLPGGLI